jgi:hypothetical protein
MLVRREVWEQVGFFDERCFAYYEDLDFCLRARRAGFTIVNVPAARMWHKVAQTAGLDSPGREFLLARGSVLFFARHAGWRWPFVMAARTGHAVKRVVVALASGRAGLAGAYLRGLFEGVRDAARA